MKDPDLENLIDESGHELQADFVDQFTQDGWTAFQNKHYTDISSRKSREIDVIFEKTYEVSEMFGHVLGRLCVRLFFSCKHFPTKYLLHPLPKEERVVEDAINNAGIISSRDLQSGFGSHHYFSDAHPTVIKAWDFKGDDLMFKAWNSSVHSLIGLERTSALASPVINLPVIGTRHFNNLFLRDRSKVRYKKVASNQQLEIDYHYLDLKDRELDRIFLVDLIALNTVKEFLADIDKDVKMAQEKMRARHRQGEFSRLRRASSPIDDYL